MNINEQPTGTAAVGEGGATTTKAKHHQGFTNGLIYYSFKRNF